MYYAVHQNQLDKATVKLGYHMIWACADGFFGSRDNNLITILKSGVRVHLYLSVFRDLFPG